MQGILSNNSVTLSGRGARGRFGFSLVNLGDIDDDNLEDFAVGAPYTDADSSPSYGSVFIFCGRKDLNNIETSRIEVSLLVDYVMNFHAYSSVLCLVFL